ncbi:hypothetical protein [Streptomyces malaysiensis]|uniref:Uncharacterized protein n=1 Tax=Streptomyces malaysiensis subsp. samsunensis TaxID=459658 RepID=A0A9X2LU36_STRMQ|nr:hypothetical protein [Streptomyces samsunensis]MCQ8829270.1 hypothetical protein [Streptomyces samsunensis]
MTRQKLTRLTGSGNGECSQNDCPNIYRDETDGGIVVQGDICEAFQPPNGEALVKIPEHVMREAIRALGG